VRISVFGSGRWATFLAWYAASCGHGTLLRGRPGSKGFDELRASRRAGCVELQESVEMTSDIRAALLHGEMYLVAISAQQLGSLCKEIRAVAPRAEGIYVLCMKGLEEQTGLRLSQVVSRELGDVPCAVWVGPGHPQNYVRGVPGCMLIDSADGALTRSVADALSSKLIRFYYGCDLVGAEIGAAAKNVVGIAAGMLDGLDFPELKGVLMARGAREVSRLAQAMGGDPMTVYGISHLGDYEATLFSPHSHNRRYGECFARGEPYALLAEGVPTARSLRRLSREGGAEMPITEAVCAALEGEMTPQEAVTQLFMRPLKTEFFC
jgi:glycerol-3-phosphate dehydrogenase (NAD(P)+)